MAKKKKVFSLLWACEEFEDHSSYFTKPMFGGLAIYLHDKMVMVLTEKPGDREYRGADYGYDIWNGIMYPTDWEHHQSLQQEFPGLVSHPVLGKWLYLHMGEESFEQLASQLSERVAVNDPRFGIVPGKKGRKVKN